MHVYPEKNRNYDIKRKMMLLTINTSKTPTPLTKTKNINNNNEIPKKTNKTKITTTNIISPSNINSNNVDRTKKIIFQNYFKNNSRLKNFYTNQNSIENDSIRKKDTHDIKDFKKNFTKNIFTNFYDINNNNYFLNLYDSSTSIPLKYKVRNPIINNKNFYTKNLSRNIKYKDNSFNKSTKNSYYYETSITETNNSNYNYINNKYNNNSVYVQSSDTKKMLNNYRNKLLKEFLKYLKKFYLNYYKKDFIFFINELKTLKNKKNIKKFIYSKKIQKQPFHKITVNKKESSIDTLIKKRKIFINKKINRNSYHLTDRKIESKNIASKIINNHCSELVDGKIRNIFLDSSFLNEANSIDVDGINNIYTHQNSSSIDNNHSFRGKKHRIFLGNVIPSSSSYEKDNKYKYKTIDITKDNSNYREIKINFQQIEELKKEKIKNKNLSFNNKINIRFNYITFQGKKYNNKINNNNYANIICPLVNSFSIISEPKKEDKKNLFSEGRKKYFRLFKNNRFLSSIKEEDEKYSLSIQDSISVENTKIFGKDNIYNPQYKQNRIKLKTKINDYCKNNYKKLLLNKLKYYALLFKANKTNKSTK